MAKMVLNKFGEILSDSFDGNVEIKKYSPTANIPMEVMGLNVLY